MSITLKRLASAAAVLLVGAGVAAAASGSGQPTDRGVTAPVRCEIISRESGGMITLQGVVHAAKSIEGEYSLNVRGAGRSGGTDITQGGPFSVGAGEPAELGQMMLGRGAYDATLVVTSGSKTWRCSERIGSI